MKGHSMPGILSLTAIGCIAVLFLSAGLSAEIIPNSYYQEVSGNDVPILDAVQFKSQAYVEKELADQDMTLYVKRPYGYVKSSSADHGANLSIVKTNIEWNSKNQAVIKGEIKNLDDKTIDLVVITFNLYNADGSQIGNAYASIDYLSPKTTWKFATEPIERSDLQFERYGSIYIGSF